MEYLTCHLYFRSIQTRLKVRVLNTRVHAKEIRVALHDSRISHSIILLLYVTKPNDYQ